MSEPYTPPPIVGYRPLSQDQVDMMNRGKNLAIQVGQYIDEVLEMEDVDPRWVAIGKTDLQKGFMSVLRGIAQPDSF